MPTQQEEAMLNQIIKDWVGEEKTEKTIHTPNCVRGTCKKDPLMLLDY